MSKKSLERSYKYDKKSLPQWDVNAHTASKVKAPLLVKVNPVHEQRQESSLKDNFTTQRIKLHIFLATARPQESPTRPPPDQVHDP